jgi:cytochrome c2
MMREIAQTTVSKMLYILSAILAAAFLFLLPEFRELDLFFEQDHSVRLLGGLFAASFLVAWSARHLPLVQKGSLNREFFHIGVLTILATQPALLAIIIFDIGLSRRTLILELSSLFLALTITSYRVPRAIQVIVFAVLTSTIGLKILSSDDQIVQGEATFLSSSYHDLELTPIRITNSLGADHASGGAIVILDESRLLLVEGNGRATIFDYDDTSLVLNRVVSLNIPIDRSPYLATNRPGGTWFRVTDALVVRRDTGLSLLVTYSNWNEEEDCFTLRMSEAPWDGGGAIAAESWTVRFESSPCIALTNYTNATGGRMAVLDEQDLLFSVGNHSFEDDPELVQARAEVDYGRILRVNYRTWEVSNFSHGHRNIQGLLVSNGKIWSTEHGPWGGDELNLVEADNDYGWPYASYGTDYSGKSLTYGKLGDHSGYRRPIYAWSPSIGVSSLISVNSKRFPAWHGDLIVGSLQGLGNGYSLYRVRVREGRMVSSERIYTGQPVRDLVELTTGQLALWNGKDLITIVSESAAVFSQCAGCHSTRLNEHGVGPTLNKIVGSKVGRHKDFEYSSALKAYGGQRAYWTEQRLDEFIANPAQVIPGTSMQHGGIMDEKQRKAIIRYLKQTAR